MIVDTLEHAETYYPLSPRIERALRYLQVLDAAAAAPGRHEIAGDQVFAMVQQYDSKPQSEGFWEAHRNYIDVQYVAAGSERIGYAPVSALTEGEYDADRDFLALSGDGQFVQLDAGMFAILAPQDAHMPGMAVEAPAAVTKVVVKVHV